MDELLDDNFIGSLMEFASSEEGVEILKLSRKRTVILDNMVETYNIDVDELTQVFEEAQQKSVDFRDHDLILYDYLEVKVGRVSELQQMREILAQEVLLMKKLNKNNGINSEMTH